MHAKIGSETGRVRYIAACIAVSPRKPPLKIHWITQYFLTQKTPKTQNAHAGFLNSFCVHSRFFENFALKISGPSAVWRSREAGLPF